MDASLQCDLTKLEKFVSFISSSGNGHSLISSFIDAHSDALVSRERLILCRLYDGKTVRDRALNHIVAASAEYTSRSRPHKGSGTKHVVPGFYNGVSQAPKVIGDKHGWGVSCYLTTKDDFVSSLHNKLNLPLYFIHIYRHPLNVIAHLKKFYLDKSLNRIIDIVLHRQSVSEQAFCRCLDMSIPTLSVQFEKLVKDPINQIHRIFDFLGLRYIPNLVSACCGVIQPELSAELNEVDWESSHLDKIGQFCSKYGYRLDG